MSSPSTKLHRNTCSPACPAVKPEDRPEDPSRTQPTSNGGTSGLVTRCAVAWRERTDGLTRGFTARAAGDGHPDAPPTLCSSPRARDKIGRDRGPAARIAAVVALCITSLALHGCWWDDSTSGSAAPAHYTIGGTISGLSTTGLVLSSGGDSLTVSASSTSFSFPSAVAAGASYTVTISAQPADAHCVVAGGSGTVGAGAVTSVAITCTAITQTVGGSITGLTTAGLMLANGSDSVSPPANATSFVFPHPLAEGSGYTVAISVQPSGAHCTLANATGTVGSAGVTNVQVSCVALTQTIGGGITGLVTAGLVLANGTDVVSPAVNATSFIFPQAVAEGATYAVTVQAQPASATCVVSNGSGTVGAVAVGSIMVTCTPRTYHVGGTITGLTAPGLVLANGSDTVSVAQGATSYTLPTALASGTSYSVTVKTQPTGLTCTVAGTFPATIGGADVTNIAVTCGGVTQLPLLVGRETCPATGPKVIPGTGASASAGFAPEGMAFDSAGNLYSVDDAGVVLKITPTGVLTIVAGQEFMGGNPPPEVDGTGAAASFNTLHNIAVELGGANAYVTDVDELRKVTAGGVVTTLVHNISLPYGVAVNSTGTVYFTDWGTSSIQAVSPGGAVTTLAGGATTGSANGTGSAAQFNFPSGLAIDGAGNLYVADTLNSLIRKVTPAGVVTTLAGGAPHFQDGTGTAAGFGQPKNLTIDATGNLYVADQVQTAVRKVTPAGVVTTVATTPVFASQYGLTPPPGAVLLPVLTTSTTFAITANDTLIVPIGCALEKTGL